MPITALAPVVDRAAALDRYRATLDCDHPATEERAGLALCVECGAFMGYL